jgi:hypothetical protein
MKPIIATLLFAATIVAGSDKTQQFIGVVTDTMCGAKHTMGVTPDAKCVQKCVKMSPSTKYALLVGKDIYVLSDQQTAASFAAQKVVVTGTLYPKTKVLKVEKIEAADPNGGHSGHPR